MDQNTSIFSLLKRLWAHITPRRRGQFALLLLLMVSASFAEILSIGAVLPFLAVLTAPEKIINHPTTQSLIHKFGYTTLNSSAQHSALSTQHSALRKSALRKSALSTQHSALSTEKISTEKISTEKLSTHPSALRKSALSTPKSANCLLPTDYYVHNNSLKAPLASYIKTSPNPIRNLTDLNGSRLIRRDPKHRSSPPIPRSPDRPRKNNKPPHNPIPNP